MKNILLKTILIFLLLTTSYTTDVYSQPPPPPPGGHGETTNKVPRDVPIGGGLEILVGLAAIYGGLRLRRELKSKEAELEL